MNFLKLGRCLAVAVAFAAGQVTLPAAIYYTAASNTSTNGYDWNSANTWTSGAIPTTGHDYVANNSAYSLRTPSGSSTFGGHSLTVNSTGASAIAWGIRTGDGAISSVDLLTLGFSRLTASASDNKISRLSVGTLTLSGTSDKRTQLDSVVSGTNRTLSLKADTVTGSGYLVTVGATTGNVLLDFADASAFTGTLEHSMGTLAFGQDLNMGSGTLLIDSTATAVSLAYNVTVNSLIIGTTALEAGSYSVAELNGYLGIFSGTSTITVVPEPSTCALAFVGIVFLGARLRRTRNLN